MSLSTALYLLSTPDTDPEMAHLAFEGASRIAHRTSASLFRRLPVPALPDRVPPDTYVEDVVRVAQLRGMANEADVDEWRQRVRRGTMKRDPRVQYFLGTVNGHLDLARDPRTDEAHRALARILRVPTNSIRLGRVLRDHLPVFRTPRGEWLSLRQEDDPIARLEKLSESHQGPVRPSLIDLDLWRQPAGEWVIYQITGGVEQ